MKRALLLNCNGEPLQFVDGMRAIKLMLKGRVEVAFGATGLPSYWEDNITSPTRQLKLPAVIRLKNFVHKRSYKRPPKFQKRVLFNRDAWSCQYCGVELNYSCLTIDHVFPSSRGGKTCWRNCVTACKKCNSTKANKTPEEAGMKLMKQPLEPTALHYWDLAKSAVWHDDWNLFVSQ